MINRLFLLTILFATASVEAKKTPVTLPDFLNHMDATGTEPWRPSSFNEQDSALGYHKGAFDVPKGMEARVNFWKDIYTKYSTDQGVIHDSRFIDIIYDEVDFNPIMQNTELSLLQKEKLRRKLVEDKKKAVEEILKKLSTAKDSDDLSKDERRVWKAFQAVPEEDKFNKAAEKGRLRFQLGQSNRFLLGIYYSGFYLPEMEKIFKEEGMPIELTRLPFVESSFNVRARSRVGASGIWQFMRRTATRYLATNVSMDERNDPLKATKAAAKFLRLNHNMLGKWPLAVTAYNHGPSGVRRMVNRFQTDDIVELVDSRHGRFQFASANFYASFLAALEVEKNAEKHFGSVVRAKPKQTQLLVVTASMNKQRLSRDVVLSWFEGNRNLAELYNPHIRSEYWSGKINLVPGTFLRIPESKWLLVQTDIYGEKAPVTAQPPPLLTYEILPATKDDATTTDELTTSTVEADQAVDAAEGNLEPVEIVHVVNAGETVEQVADAYGVPVRNVINSNNLQPHRPVRAGVRLIIPFK
jgi:membrane-bound lytic murein transglycosylase D